MIIVGPNKITALLSESVIRPLVRLAAGRFAAFRQRPPDLLAVSEGNSFGWQRVAMGVNIIGNTRAVRGVDRIFPTERCRSGRTGRSRKPLSLLRGTEGSNPSLSAMRDRQNMTTSPTP